MKKNVELDATAVSGLLSDAVNEARRGAALVDQVRALVAMTNPQLREITEGFEQIAAQAQALATQAALEAARHANRGREFTAAAEEVAALAQRCAEARDHVRRLLHAAAEIEAQRGAKLTRLTSPIRPADTLPSTIS